MVSPEEFYSVLSDLDIGFYTGIPDSLLKDFCAFVDDNLTHNHVISANEGAAVAIAAGRYMATGTYPAVYMQNSGLGNAINPLVSLADPQVYGIPMLLIIGWRGEPGVKDEPQHVKQGQITLSQLDVLDIPYEVLDSHLSYEGRVKDLVGRMASESRPVALVVKKIFFAKYQSQDRDDVGLEGPIREQVIDLLVDKLNENDLVVSTTGKTSRELFEVRANKGLSNSDFLTVGSMGHASAIGLGVALGVSNKKRLIILDGDGAAIMHLGNMLTIGTSERTNILHIVLNNGCHESVGGQPTNAHLIDFEKIALGCGYKAYFKCTSLNELADCLDNLPLMDNKFFCEISIKKGSRENLGRPTLTPKETKDAFVSKVRTSLGG